MEKEIKVSVGKIRELEASWRQAKYLSFTAENMADNIRGMFPEAFAPEKHWAIKGLEALLDSNEVHHRIKVSIQHCLTAFNDDGSLKETR